MKSLKTGFIYLWKDKKRKKYYLGSHQGLPTDNYIGSNRRFYCKYKSRPDTFKRRILQTLEYYEHKELLQLEQQWLSLIKDEELHGVKYYNEKKVASGGDIYSTLSEDRKKEFKEKSLAPRQAGIKIWRQENPDRVREIAIYARSCVKNTSRPSFYGEKNHFFGKTHSEETKRKMSDAKKGKPSTRKNYKHSDETKQKISENTHNTRPFYTPEGYFKSYIEYHRYNNIITDMGIKNILKDCDKPISKMRADRCPLFDESVINKTPRELGYFYA